MFADLHKDIYLKIWVQRMLPLQGTSLKYIFDFIQPTVKGKQIPRLNQ